MLKLYLVNKWTEDARYYLEEHYGDLVCNHYRDNNMVSLFPQNSWWLYRYRATELKRKLNETLPNQ